MRSACLSLFVPIEPCTLAVPTLLGVLLTAPACLPACLPAGWTLTSISGFSQAFSRAVDSAVAIRTSTGGVGPGDSGGGAAGGGGGSNYRPPPAHLGHGLTQVGACCCRAA